MKIETPIIAMILSGVVFAGMFTLLFGLADDNDVNYDLSKHTYNDTSFNDAFDVVNQSKAEMDEIIEDFEDETVTDTGSTFGFLSLAFKVGKQFFNSLSLFKNMAVMAGNFLGIPAFIVGALVSILLVVVIVSIILLITGRSQ